MADCNSRKWYIFVIVDIVIMIGGITLSLIGRGVRRALRVVRFGKSRRLCIKAVDDDVASHEVEEYLWIQRMRLWAAGIISGRNISGRVIVFFACACTITSVSIYVFEATMFPQEIEYCEENNNRKNLFRIDFACNCFFLVYFIMRFLAAEDKVFFWLGIYSLVDIFTIPSIFVTLYLNHSWSGLRFLRAIWIIKLPELFQYFSILSTKKRIRLFELFTLFFSTWIAGSGLVHLLENTGDPWRQPSNTNRQSLTFFECLYFTIVTMSTVGYGDFSPKTDLGRVWICLFIMISFAMFASSIPEIVQLITSGSVYTGGYHKQKDHKHIVVCGDVTHTSVETLISDLKSSNLTKNKINIVLLDPEEPQVTLQNLLKKHINTVKYVKGTVMDRRGLRRVYMADADACLIMADCDSDDPNEEDSVNILRVIAIKNYNPALRVIVQLLRFENKSSLTHLSTWDNQCQDTVICYNELELGILAKSCLIPGFSTFITNLFSIYSIKDFVKYPSSDKAWIESYQRGVGMELYTERFSSSLTSMTIQDLVAFCYKAFSILLIALEVKINGKLVLVLNPSSMESIDGDSTGYFIARSFFDTRRVTLYCKLCHGNDGLTAFRTDTQRCQCLRSIQRPKPLAYEFVKTTSHLSQPSTEYKSELLHSSFKDFQTCHVKDPRMPLGYSNHILLCIFSNECSPLIGLRNFIEPLRTKDLRPKEVRPIVIVGNETLLEKEWLPLACIPNIHTVSLVKINKESLQLLGLENCHVCIFMSTKGGSNCSSKREISFVDNEVILATLHAKAIVNNGDLASTRRKRSPKIISKVVVEGSVQLLEPDSEYVSNYPVCISQSFACGNTFVTSSLKSLSCLSYLNPSATRILGMLTVGSSLKLDRLESRGDHHATVDHCHLKVVSLLKQQFEACFCSKTHCLYLNVFMAALTHGQAISLALYRSSDGETQPSTVINKCVIITNPPADFMVHRSDSLLVLRTRRTGGL